MSALVKGMENGMKEALIAIGGLEKVRVEEQDIPAEQQHLADQAVGCTMNDVYALQAQRAAGHDGRAGNARRATLASPRGGKTTESCELRRHLAGRRSR